MGRQSWDFAGPITNPRSPLTELLWTGITCSSEEIAAASKLWADASALLDADVDYTLLGALLPAAKRRRRPCVGGARTGILCPAVAGEGEKVAGLARALAPRGPERARDESSEPVVRAARVDARGGVRVRV